MIGRMASTLDLLDDELDQINLELEDDGVSGSRFAGRSKVSAMGGAAR